jgi:hypothetical protein
MVYYVSYSNQGGLAHLFDVLLCAMLNFAHGGGKAAYVAASLRHSYIAPLATGCGNVVRVLQFEQDKS